jgi:teichuronic acid biosynthesis glycosyltransferase TuaC
VKILTFSTLYPSEAQPQHGVFVENRLLQLLSSGQVEARVVAPVPWFPFTHSVFGQYAAFARSPRHEQRNGLSVDHPRHLVIPKLGMNITPALLYASARSAISALIDNGFEFDLIDAHYFYPEGVAAAKLGEYFGKPVTITARGTDINLIPQYPGPRRQIIQAAERAAGLISVSQALKDEMVSLGISADKIRVLRNGVDLSRFHPVDGSAIRAMAPGAGPVVVSVGHLIPRKGHDLVIKAMELLPDMQLLIVGQGPDYNSLRELSRTLGVADRVQFLGAVAHEKMAEVYSAADALVLASSREGWANVLLEAMACGTPVVATNVWGAPEAVTTPAAGVLVQERTPQSIAEAVTALFSRLPSREATRNHAMDFDWSDTTNGQLTLFEEILSRNRP